MKNAMLKLFLSASVLAAAICTTALGATTIVENLGDGGWTLGDTRDGSGTSIDPAPGRVDLNVASPGTPPSGYNSLRLVTDTGSSKATLHQSGVNLGAIADFSGSYSWYKTTAGAAAPAFKLGIDTADSNPASSRPGEALFDKFLIYEPYDNPDSADPGVNVWVTQSFDQTNGDWWLVDRTAGNLQVNPPHSSLSLSEWLSDGTYGTLLSGGTIVAAQLGIGSGNENLNSYVDTLTYTYGASPTTETYYFGTAVPEPSTVGLLGVGALALLSRRSRRS